MSEKVLFQFNLNKTRDLTILSHHMKKTIKVAIILTVLPKEATECQ